jgi:hypothetical protein
MTFNPHPIPNSYWAEPHRFLAGPLPTHPERQALRAMITALFDAGIRTVIDLRTPAEPPSVRAFLDKLAPVGVDPVWIGAPVGNGYAPNIAQMQAALDAIDASLARDRPVYVHCAGGLGRTGNIVACWWIRHGRYDPEGALAALTARRAGQPNADRPSPETGAQFRLVRGWKPGQ